MRFEPEALHGANNGLNVARTLMEKVKTEFDWISYGDLWTLAGVCAVQVSISLSLLSLFLTALRRKWQDQRFPGRLVVLTVSLRM